MLSHAHYSYPILPSAALPPIIATQATIDTAALGAHEVLLLERALDQPPCPASRRRGRCARYGGARGHRKARRTGQGAARPSAQDLSGGRRAAASGALGRQNQRHRNDGGPSDGATTLSRHHYAPLSPAFESRDLSHTRLYHLPVS
jgi:hypothetical protein